MFIPYVNPEGDKATLIVDKSPKVQNFGFYVFENPDKCRNRQLISIVKTNEIEVSVNKPLAVGWDFTTLWVPGIALQACAGILQFMPEKDHRYLLSVEPEGGMCKIGILDQTSYKRVYAISKKWQGGAWDERGPWCK